MTDSSKTPRISATGTINGANEIADKLVEEARLINIKAVEEDSDLCEFVEGINYKELHSILVKLAISMIAEKYIIVPDHKL